VVTYVARWWFPLAVLVGLVSLVSSRWSVVSFVSLIRTRVARWLLVVASLVFFVLVNGRLVVSFLLLFVTRWLLVLSFTRH
jgi:hypothetical protein